MSTKHATPRKRARHNDSPSSSSKSHRERVAEAREALTAKREAMRDVKGGRKLRSSSTSAGPLNDEDASGEVNVPPAEEEPTTEEQTAEVPMTDKASQTEPKKTKASGPRVQTRAASKKAAKKTRTKTKPAETDGDALEEDSNAKTKTKTTRKRKRKQDDEEEDDEEDDNLANQVANSRHKPRALKDVLLFMDTNEDEELEPPHAVGMHPKIR